MLDRRDLLKAAAAAGLLPVGRYAMPAMAAVPPAAPAAPRRLIVVFMRGAVDGLSVVVPYSEGDYYRARSTIALARPGQDGGVLDLDGRFG
ncbi:MAG TPA: twin-arginine translocation signal domain-containing protein, partial [Methylibium sp.]